MPAGIRPKNCKGKKGRSGRKKQSVEFKMALAKAKKQITDEILSGKAKNITNSVLDSIIKSNRVNLETMSKIVIPIAKEGMKKELGGSFEIKQITGTVIKKDAD